MHSNWATAVAAESLHALADRKCLKYSVRASACRSSQQPALATNSATKFFRPPRHRLMLRNAAADCQFESLNRTALREPLRSVRGTAGMNSRRRLFADTVKAAKASATPHTASFRPPAPTVLIRLRICAGCLPSCWRPKQSGPSRRCCCSAQRQFR